MKTINTGESVFLVQWQNGATQTTICTLEGLTEALKYKNQGGILYKISVLEFKQGEAKFKKIPLNKYSAYFGFNTEAYEILKSIYKNI